MSSHPRLSAPEIKASQPISPSLLVRIGLLGQVGRFIGHPMRWERGQRVVCRTARGVEMGVVLAEASCLAGDPQSMDGRVLRRTTPEDELLWGHLRQLADQAYSRCASWLAEHQSTAVLLDVEPLLDGRTLYFHFLADVDTQLQHHLDDLAEIYERQVRRSKFAQLLEHGCGPGCGTDQAKNGCGTRGGCAVCSVASRCGSQPNAGSEGST